MNDKHICAQPFYYFEIGVNGDVFPCCPAYCKGYSFGNLLRNSLEEIWKGERAWAFRNRIMQGDYSLCDLNACASRNNYSDLQIKQSFFRAGKLLPPKTMVISYDCACNLHCNICRPALNLRGGETEKLTIEKNYFSYLGNCDHIYMSGAGDPFASKYARGLIRRVVAAYPQIKFDFITNGQLLTPKMYRDLKLENRVDDLRVSVHASRPDVYQAVTGSGKFELLLRNLAFFTRLKHEKRINSLVLNFVVTDVNYKNMPEFVDFAEKHEAIANFTCYRKNYNEPFASAFASHAVHLPEHPQFSLLLDTLHKPALQAGLRSGHVAMDGALRALAQRAKVTGKSTNPKTDACAIEALLAGLRVDQRDNLRGFNKDFGFNNKVIMEVGSDLDFAVARVILKLGAVLVYAVNPALPENAHPDDERIVVIRAGAEKTGLADSSLDAIFGVAVLEHISDPEAVARECARLLKPEGICYLQGNPLWTSAAGHHLWIERSAAGAAYKFNDNSRVWDDWEHLVIKNEEEAKERLKAKGVPEQDLGEIIYATWKHPHISRKTPTEIANSFQKIFGAKTRIRRDCYQLEKNRYYHLANLKYSEDDLLCTDLCIVLDKSEIKKFDLQNANIICLGYTAIASVLLKLLGIKNIEHFSQNAMPFDYNFVWFDYMLDFISSDFAGYDSDLSYDATQGCWTARNACLIFNHDADLGANGREKLVERLKCRADNFRKAALNELEPVFFLSAYFLPAASERIGKLVAMLRKIRDDRPFRLIVIGEENELINLPPQAEAVTVPFPFASLDLWWLPANRNSEAVSAYLQALSEKLNKIFLK